jgi:hypothetical protein
LEPPARWITPQQSQVPPNLASGEGDALDGLAGHLGNELIVFVDVSPD